MPCHVRHPLSLSVAFAFSFPLIEHPYYHWYILLSPFGLLLEILFATTVGAFCWRCCCYDRRSWAAKIKQNMSYNLMRNVCFAFYCFQLLSIHWPWLFPHFLVLHTCDCLFVCLFVETIESHPFNGRVDSLFTYTSFKKEHVYYNDIIICTVALSSTSTVHHCDQNSFRLATNEHFSVFERSWVPYLQNKNGTQNQHNTRRAYNVVKYTYIHLQNLCVH